MLHTVLDRYFKQRLSFSIFFRIWFAMALVFLVIGAVSFYALQKTIRPSAKRVVEDVLVDSSRLLAVVVAEDVAKGVRPLVLPNRYQNQYTIPAWYDQKHNSHFHVYITDDKGIVIYDSKGQSVGADFSRWNDIYLTLQGKYGARSTEINGSSVMYVASPIIKEGKLIGVISVGKPTIGLDPYLKSSEKELIKILLNTLLISLVVSAAVAWWLRHSIAQITRYTKSLASIRPPHFYLAEELNELSANIKQMKDDIENKAYITDYVHSLTHELKSPLAAIKASNELLAEELPVADRQHFSGLIDAQTDRLAVLVDKLLTLAKVEQPDFRLNRQKISLMTLAEYCLMQQSAWINKKGITTRMIALTQNHIWADEFWITQAIQNVLDNAICHAHRFVLVVVDEVDVWVINDGERIPDYVLAQAFERYFSYTPLSYQQQTKGTGLGLTLVKQIMMTHEGEAKLYQSTIQSWLEQANYPQWAQQTISSWISNITQEVVIMQLHFDKKSSLQDMV